MSNKGLVVGLTVAFGAISVFIFLGLFMMKKSSSENNNSKSSDEDNNSKSSSQINSSPGESEPEPKSEPEPELEAELEERLSENGNPFCKGYLVINGCNSKKYPRNPQHSMDNPNLVNCDKRFVSVANTESSTGYLQCKLSKDGKSCNSWNEVDKTDKVKCDLELDGLPYCESDILHGHGPGMMIGQMARDRAKKNFEAFKAKCRCEEGKSVKGDTIKPLIGPPIPSYQWYCG